MSDYQLFFILLFAILFALGWIGWYLHRILNILIMKNKGEPSNSDLNGLAYDKMANSLKKK